MMMGSETSISKKPGSNEGDSLSRNKSKDGKSELNELKNKPLSENTTIRDVRENGTNGAKFETENSSKHNHYNGSKNNVTSSNQKSDSVIKSSYSKMNGVVQNPSNGSKPDENCYENDMNDLTNDIDQESNDSEDKPYKCHICPKQFARKSGLNGHVLLHIKGPQSILSGSNGSAPGTSEEVVVNNNNDDDVNLVPEKEADSVHNCVMCEKRFTKKSALKSHILQFHVDEPTNSNGRRSSSELEMTERGYACVICDQRFSRKSSLIMHYKNHPNGRKSDIPKELLQEEVPNLAVNIVSGKVIKAEEDECKPYKCDVCGKEFNRNSSLQWHLQFHENEKKKDQKDRDTPTEEEKGKIDEKTGEVKKSKRIRKDSIDVDDTKSLVDDEGEYQCQLCDKKFNRKTGLYRHVGHHTRWRHAKQEEAQTDIDLSLPAEIQGNDEDNQSVTEFKCQFCEKDFKDKRSMKIHRTHAHRYQMSEMENYEETKEEETEFGCEYCDRIFQSKRARTIHTVISHKSKELHEEEMEPESQFSCSYCDREFNSGRSLSLHVTAQHRSDKVYKCDSCDKEFLLFLDLREHLATECNDKKLHACMECPKSFAHPKSLSRHIREHKKNKEEEKEVEKENEEEEEDEEEEDEEPEEKEEEEVPALLIKCNLCPRNFHSNKGMAGHMKVHSADIREREKMKLAANSHTPTSALSTTPVLESPKLVKKKVYVCPFCSKEYDNNPGYAGHMKRHRREAAERKQLEEQEEKDGGNETNHVSNLEEDKVDETAKKVFICRFCGVNFTSGTQLGGHVRIHMRKKVPEPEADSAEFTCHDCGETYSTKKGLSEHIRVHDLPSTVLPSSTSFKCHYCRRHFNTVGSLKTHMYKFHRSKVHDPDNGLPKSGAAIKTPEVPQTCDLCTQQFSTSKELRRHSMTGCNGLPGSPRKRPVDESLKCDYCDQAFVLRCHLQKHLKSRCNAVDLESVENDEGPPLGKRARRSTFMSSMFEYDTVGAYHCTECDKSFTTSQGLHRHQQRHKQPKPVSPASLKFTFKDGDANSEIEAQYREKPYECVYCGLCFGDKESLFQHVKTHSETEELSENYIKLHAGERCVIVGSDGYEEHFFFEQFDQNEGYECNECFETIKDKLQMIVHITHHLKTRKQDGDVASLMIKVDATLLAPFKCMFCDERFVKKSYRVQHLRKYHPHEVLQCDVCHKLFLSKAKLKQHCSQHVVDTKYRCEYCRKCFTSKWFLLRHARRHCSKKPAEENGLKFMGKEESAQKDPLGTDVKDEIVMYRCENCDFESVNKDEVENHSCLHTMNILSCKCCMETFLEEQDLSTHMHTSHNEVTEAQETVVFEPKFNPSL